MENGSGSNGGNTNGLNSETIPIAHRAEPTSNFRGVLKVKSGKWGARICLKYKPYWLGTYDKEEEAAAAFDRAALKLLRSDARLNFPQQNYTTQEITFQGEHSSEEILGMLKNHTYKNRFMAFLARKNPPADGARRQILNQKLFQKELTHTDVSILKGLHIPKEFALRYFLPLPENQTSAELTFYDKDQCPWTFRLTYWISTKCYVFTKGWRNFVTTKNLNVGDTVMFFRYVFEEEGQRKTIFTVDVRFRVRVLPVNAGTENGGGGENAEQGASSGGHVNAGTENGGGGGNAEQGASSGGPVNAGTENGGGGGGNAEQGASSGGHVNAGTENGGGGENAEQGASSGEGRSVAIMFFGFRLN